MWTQMVNCPSFLSSGFSLPLPRTGSKDNWPFQNYYIYSFLTELWLKNQGWLYFYFYMFMNQNPIQAQTVSAPSPSSPCPYITWQLDSSHFQDIYSDVWVDLLNAHLLVLAEFIFSL